MSLTLQQISQRFGTLRALDAVDFAVAAGEVHALLGENGAGKSTLMHVAFGLLRPDAGVVLVGDEADEHHYPQGFKNPAAARAAGIAMVHQHFTSIGAFTVAENVALSGGWHESGRAARAKALALIEETALPLDPDVFAGSLNVSQRQRLEILKALAAGPKILLLDEPTAVLAPREVRELARAVERFADRGGAVVLITHKLPEALTFSRQVTVLRRGKVVLNGATASLNADTIARAMLGDGNSAPRVAVSSDTTATSGEVRIRAEGLTLAGPNTNGSAAVRAASLVCRAGEIVGVVALEGNGQRELLRAFAGVGSERIDGTLQVSTPVAFIPEDRTTEALIPSFSLTDNLLLGTLTNQLWIQWSAARRRTAELVAEYDVRAQSPDDLAASLSGGNQQKLVFARAMERKPRVLIAEQPTRGLDLRATAEIHQRLRDAARNGIAVVVHSADLDEVLQLADRILVVANGVVKEVPTNATRDEIGDAMLDIRGEV